MNGGERFPRARCFYCSEHATGVAEWPALPEVAGPLRIHCCDYHGRLVVSTADGPGPARVSNITIASGGGDGFRRCVYWQTARWLVDNGYADEVDGPVGTEGYVEYVQLTDKGRDLLAHAQLMARRIDE